MLPNKDIWMWAYAKMEPLEAYALGRAHVSVMGDYKMVVLFICASAEPQRIVRNS